MDKLPSNPIIKFNPDQLHEVRKLFGQEDQEKLNQTIDQFADWIKKQNHFNVTEFDRGFLERLIICSKGSIERAKQRLDRMCTMRKLMPEFMENIDIKNEFHDFRDMSYTCLLPKPTEDNCRVIYCSLNVKDHDAFKVLNYFRYYIPMLTYFLNHDYAASTVLIADFREYSLNMMTRINPIALHKGMTIMIDAFAYRMKALHVVTASKFVDAALVFYRQVLSAKLAKRIHVHTSYDSLYQHIDKSIFPVDIGGEYNRTCKELCDDLFKELSSDRNIACLKYMEKATTDESRRLSSTFNEQYSGVPGSFRSLCVD